MSERANPTTGADPPVTLETGLEAFQSSSEFRGPVEHPDGHHCNDHFAQIYETDAERFATAVPFVCHGLEQDERVMYVVDESSDAEVKAALRDGGVDVTAALDAGQLSFHTVQDTYLRNGSFDPDEMIEFYAAAVAAATEEYEALRIVAELTWLQDDTATVERFMEYEAKVNDLFADEDCLALCQYDRNRFPPETVRDIVRTHPHLVYDDTVCHNFYYTPPEEFFAPDEPARENDRMLRTLRDRAAAKTELRRRERFLEKLHEITSATDREFDEKLQAVFELGCEWFGLTLGGMAKVDADGDLFEVEAVSADHDYLVPGARVDLSETYCRIPAARGGGGVSEPVEITDPVEAGFEDATCYTEFGVRAYLGTHIPVEGGLDRTFFFVAEEPRDDPITDEERTFHRLMAQWVSYELERDQRERFLRGGYEITSDPALTFDEKLQALFDLGCEQFDLDLGAMAKVDPDADLFEVEYVSDDHEHFEPGLELPLSETYCTAATDAGGVGSVDDPVEAGYDDIYVHNEFGIKAYLGTYIEVEGDLNRTFFFISEERRRGPFSDNERTFQRLLGQWVKYELERNTRERELRERTQYLSALVETAPECIKTVAADGTLLQMNPAGLEMVKAESESDVTGGCVYDLIAPEHREAFREFNEKVCGGESGMLEFDIVGLDGTRRHMESHAAPLRRPDGTTAHVALTRDITERKEHEERLERKNDRLESFASMLAHELRNPTMIGQIYSQQLPGDADAEAVEYVTEAFDRIEDMIDVMLVLTRGREAVGERTSVELADVAEQAWGGVDAPDAELAVEVDDTIEADETYIRHLFRNLLENAVEHGGADVTVTVGDLPAERSEGEARRGAKRTAAGFYVADDGPGIPPEERDAVFDEGYTTTAESGGTGLGLAFVRKLAEVYEWECAVTESADGGARIEFHVA